MLSWEASGEGQNRSQTAYQVIVKTATGGKLVWDSGKQVSPANQIEVGATLRPSTGYTWTVSLWDEKDADGEPGLNMDEFRDFAITNGLRPAELRKTAAKGSSDLLAVETQISVARRRQMLDALMGPGSPTSPEKRKQLDQLRVIENCADWAACVDPPPPKARSTRPRRPFAERLDAELSRRKRAAAVPPRYRKVSAAKKPMQALLGAFDRTKRFDMTLPKSPKRKPPRERRADPDYTAVTVYRPGSSWPAVVRVSTRPPDETAALRTVTFSSPVAVPG